MNREEFEQEIETLKDCFDDVVQMDYSSHVVIGNSYLFDAKLAEETIRKKKEIVRIKVVNDETFYVMSIYFEVDSKPYVVQTYEKLQEEDVMDTQSRKKLLNELRQYEKLIYRDSLTQTLNRDYYEDEIKGKKMTCGVAMLDMDDFRLYNETLGHDMGNQLLSSVAKTIQSQIQSQDILIRYSGDCFVLIMPNISDKALSAKLNTILKKVNDLSAQESMNLSCSMSIGAAQSENQDVDKALKSAEKCMFLAKNKKNVVILENSQFEDMEDVKQGILIVDDSSINREFLRMILEKDFKIYEVEDGIQCIHFLHDHYKEISLVLLDFNMPGMSGEEVLDYMQKHENYKEIPVIMISSEDSPSIIQTVYDLGAIDYISRPFDMTIVYQRVFNTMKLYSKQTRLNKLVQSQSEEKEKNNSMMVGILSHIVEFRNQESGMHIVHLKEFSKMLLEQLKEKGNPYHLTEETIDLISLGSALHDIGKIGVDAKILNKPGRLTKEEFEIIKTHTIIGDEMLESLHAYQDEPLIKVGHEICRWHHERWDGKGYPDGLTGEEIPISAQVVSIVDVYDALTSERVYKKAIPHQKALDMIQNGECGNFNPFLLECLMDIQDKLKAKLDEEKELYESNAN